MIPRIKTLAALAFLALLPACGSAATATDQVEVQRVLIESPAMGGRWPAVVVLPASYGKEPERRFPVLYLLHGAGNDHWSWVRYSPLARLLETRPVICVCPYGRAYGWYVDSPSVKDSKVETHVTKELVPFIDANYRTKGRREARGICGFSMGGHGAVTLAAKHPELFSSASSLSGIMDITRWPREWGISRVLGPLEENRDLWRRESVVGLAGAFTKAAPVTGPRDAGERGHEKDPFVSPSRRDVRLFIDCGLDDFAYLENRQFHELLKRLGVPHTYKEREGEHDWTYWSAHIAEHLDFHLESFRRAGKAEPAAEREPWPVSAAPSRRQEAPLQ